jgi:hypothetical protein
MSSSTPSVQAVYETVTLREMMRQEHAAIEQAAFCGGPKVLSGSEPMPDGRTRFVLRAGTIRLQTFVQGPRPAEFNTARGWVADQAVARDIVAATIAHFMDIFRERLAAGETLDPGDRMFLKH